jgi:hypothetical protein
LALRGTPVLIGVVVVGGLVNFALSFVFGLAQPGDGAGGVLAALIAFAAETIVYTLVWLGVFYTVVATVRADE